MRYVLLLLGLVLFPGHAIADPFTFPGFGAQSAALGGARAAEKAGPASLAYNPAGLNSGKQQTTVSYTWAKPLLYIDRETPSDLAAYLEQGPRGENDTAYHLIRFRTKVNDAQEESAEAAPLIRGVHFGIVVPFAEEREEASTSLGFGVFLPQGKLATVNLGGESTPYFVEFHDRNQAAVISAAVAHDFDGGWSIGGGVVVDLIQAEVDATMYVPLRFAFTDILLTDDLLLPEADIQPQLQAHVAPRVRPVAGVRWAPSSRLAFGLSFREESEGRVDGEGRVVLGAGLPQPVELPLTVSLNTHFQPRRAAAGMQWQPLDRLRVQADLTWEQWSRYRPPLAGYGVDNLRDFAHAGLAAAGILDSGLLGACLGLIGNGPCIPEEEALLARIPDGVDVRYEFSGARDIVIPRVGFGWRFTDQLEATTGYYYRPSIESASGFRLTRVRTLKDVDGADVVERDEVDSNVLDNAQHGLSLGAAYIHGPFTFAATALYVQLVEKTVDKRNNDVYYDDRAPAEGEQIVEFGYPSYSYGGSVVGGMLQVTLAY